MESQNLKQRTRSDDPTTTTNNNGTRREKKMKMAKRGVRSLAIAVAVPLCLTIANIYFFGSSQNYRDLAKPFWYPPLWAIHLACLASSFLMGLSAWLVWAEGGFHRHPAVLPLYMAQLALSLSWDPLVFLLGATWTGLAACVALFGALLECSRSFRNVNPIAGDLVMPCLAWVAFLTVVNLKLIYL
ncbi:hypothetical protein HHK36_026500 [Tetracentron sinense]|uniref:Peripheral-type benzodiazepine receptor n=1 Tax=Tetracentron sinense TaxID=13715 RepID=A0A834YF54_TETSI|nr:hypothetical protein HHK36_026500 [Tetracentron sinense]